MNWWKKKPEPDRAKPPEPDPVVEGAKRVQDALEELRRVLKEPKG